jgi:hypothetical protein
MHQAAVFASKLRWGILKGENAILPLKFEQKRGSCVESKQRKLFSLSWTRIAGHQVSKLLVVSLLCGGGTAAQAISLPSTFKEQCLTRIEVNASQTVSFYAKKVHGANYLGTGSQKETVRDNQHCFKDQVIIAMTWDEKGKKHIAKTAKPYSNMKHSLTLKYPENFKNVAASNLPILCKVRIFNNTDKEVTFYAGKARLVSQLGEAKPRQSISKTVPCFSQERLLARVTEPMGNWMYVQRYKTLTTYSSINQQPAITFPNHFEKKKDAMIPVHKYWLSLLDS